MRKYIEDFCNRFDYPEEATADLLKGYDAVCGCPEASGIFHNAVRLYEKDLLKNYNGVLGAMDAIADACNTNRWTLHLLVFICFTRHMHELYAVRGLGEDIYYDTCIDLRCKLIECKKMHNVWGAFVASWFPRFFEIDRFALGRLQFETITMPFDFEVKGVLFKKGETVINMHIPSRGKLEHDDVLASYAKAADFFSYLFPDGVTKFVCHSWLLFPAHKEILPETSNIRRFMSDFTLVEAEAREGRGDLWRIYYDKWELPNEQLPRTTGLERAYADMMAAGREPGNCMGAFVWKDGHIL